MTELWKEVFEFPNYECSSLGKIRSKKTLKILKPSKQVKGYLQVVLYVDNKKCFTRKVHRLVATSFLENPNNFPEVNHKDKDTSNNCVDNLEWCTGQYNMAHRHGMTYTLSSPSGEIVITNSLGDFARQNGLIQGNLWRVVNGKRKSHRGWTKA